MGLLDFFKPVKTKTAEELRIFLKEHGLGDYNLVDVRTPEEYGRGHIPGAIHIPVGEIGDRKGEIAPGRPTIVY